jgi:CHAT domain-containing protein
MPAKRVVLAEYFTTEELTLLFIVRADFEEPQVEEIKTPLNEMREFVTANFGVTEGGSRVRDLDLDEWQVRFGPFIEPILPWTDEGDIVWLVPHDVLHYLPLHALKVEGRYLIERNPVCYTPSASVMKYCHAKRKGRREKALVLGDSRNDLLHAREEAVAVAELFNTTPYLDGQATKSLVKEKLEKEREELDILHLACHGYFDPYQALKSGIMLAAEQNGDGAEGEDERRWNLTAEEIFGLEMRADLVTLSACESGVNERRPGDELIGLTRALIYAGTPSVMVSLWRVSSLSTQILMMRFYTVLKQGVMKAEALQQAQTALMRMTYAQVRGYVQDRGRVIEASHPDDAEALMRDLSLLALEVDRPVDAEDDTWQPFVHPYHWAPFVLVGDWK